LWHLRQRGCVSSLTRALGCGKSYGLRPVIRMLV
jgi:hypothetical protein